MQGCRWAVVLLPAGGLEIIGVQADISINQEGMIQHFHVASTSKGLTVGSLMCFAAVIALCGQRQALRRALGLMAEMRSRNISANVHTFSALMNVCIKSGELDLALDVFKQLQVGLIIVTATHLPQKFGY